jgi:hypothetical protein
MVPTMSPHRVSQADMSAICTIRRVSLARKKSDSAEIFADYTLSRLTPEVRDSLSDEQYNAIRDVLLANDSSKRHAIDIRFSLPLFFARYYLVVVAGRDRRRQTRIEELKRSHLGNLPLGASLSLVVITLTVTLFWGLLIAALYLLKRELGIDLFSEFHLLVLPEGGG